MASEVCRMIHDLRLGASKGGDALKTACGDSSKCGMTEESSQKQQPSVLDDGHINRDREVDTEEDITDDESDNDLVNKHVVMEEDIADEDSDNEFWDKYWNDYCRKRCNPTEEEIVEMMTEEYNNIRGRKSQEMDLERDGFELSPMYDIELEKIDHEMRSMDEAAEFDELLHTVRVLKRVDGRYECGETVTIVD